LADARFLEMLGERGYRISQFDNVLARSLAGVEIVITPRVRRATPNEADLWAHTVGRGFFEQNELTTEEMDVGRWVFGMPGAMCFLASAEGGTPAGGAALIVTQRPGHALRRRRGAPLSAAAPAPGADCGAPQ
jgi:hypothetical protein